MLWAAFRAVRCNKIARPGFRQLFAQLPLVAVQKTPSRAAAALSFPLPSRPRVSLPKIRCLKYLESYFLKSRFFSLKKLFFR